MQYEFENINCIQFNDNASADIRDGKTHEAANSKLEHDNKNLLTSCEEVINIIKNKPNKKSFGREWRQDSIFCN